MKKNLYWLLSLIIALSMILSACGPQATEAVEVVVEPTEAEVVEPTAEPVAEPTAEPTPEPLDYVALFTAAMADINPDKGYLNVKPATLAEELAGTAPFVLDVREASEIEAAGYIEGAVHIPVRDLMKNLDKLPGLDEPIVVTCASGHRGGFVLVALKMMGYTNVRNLSGGMGGWIKAELPVVTGVPAAPAAISTAIIENQQLWTDLDNWFSNIPEGFYSIKADKLNENLAGGATPVFIDVRSAGEWTADGYLAGAINLPIDTFMASIDQLPADKAAPVVVYCASGFRGAAAAMAMQFLGYTDVVNLAGGLGAWKTAQFPVEGWVNWPAVWTEFTASLPADQVGAQFDHVELRTAGDDALDQPAEVADHSDAVAGRRFEFADRVAAGVGHETGAVEEPAAERDAVAAHVHEDAAARARDVPEPVGVRPEVLLALLDEVDLAEGAFPRHLLGLDVLGREEELLGVHEEDALRRDPTFAFRLGFAFAMPGGEHFPDCARIGPSLALFHDLSD